MVYFVYQYCVVTFWYQHLTFNDCLFALQRWRFSLFVHLFTFCYFHYFVFAFISYLLNVSTLLKALIRLQHYIWLLLFAITILFYFFCNMSSVLFKGTCIYLFSITGVLVSRVSSVAKHLPVFAKWNQLASK